MSNNENSFELLQVVELKKIELSRSQPLEIHRLEISLQSIAKRVDYCKYHYQEFQRNSSVKALLTERIDRTINGRSIRVLYEANSIAFLQNIHALIDSFPYVLNIINREIEDIESTNIGWNDNFIKKYKRYDFHTTLNELFSDITFHMVKGFVYRANHKHLIRIKNTYDELVFEEFTYHSKGEIKTLKDQNVNQFILECHEKLLSKFIGLCNQVQKCKKQEIEGNGFSTP
jgi:hypothetical protein